MEAHNARLGIIPMLAQQHSDKYIGRTKLMKYMYFLQVLRCVPLGYHFSMYSYGPFDSDVLADLSLAEAMNLVSSQAVLYPGGYGYEIRSGSSVDRFKEQVIKRFPNIEQDTNWVISEFGSYNSSEIELLSTITYVNHELNHEENNAGGSEVIQRVLEIKPHFSREQVERYIEVLRSKQLLDSPN